MKIRQLLLLLFLSFSLSHAQIPTNDLSKAYTFSSLNFTNIANTGTYDLSVTGANNATATSDASGATNEAVDLNGTTFNGGLHPTGTGGFTISFWIKTLSTGQSRILTQFNNTSNFNAGYFINILANGNLNFTGTFRYGSNYSTPGSVFTTAVNDGNWHHIVVVGRLIVRTMGSPTTGFSRSNRYEYLIYKDNVLGQVDSTSAILEGGNQQVFLFSNSPELQLGSSSYNDELDNYREYTRALSPLEIDQLFNEFAPKTIFVDKDAVGTNDGTTWENAYTDFNSVITTLNDNDEIWVAEGTYSPPNRTTIFTIANTGVKIYGGFAGGETQISDRIFGANETIISGDLANNDGTVTPSTNFTVPPPTKSDNAFALFNITNYSDTNPTVFDGLSITHAFGNAVTIQNGNIIPNIIFRNVQFKYNVAQRGASIVAYNLFNNTSTTIAKVIIDQCVFEKNAAFRGGGLYFATSASTAGNVGDQEIEITISNSLFDGNITSEDSFNSSPQGPYDGSAFYILRQSDRFAITTKVVNNTFVNNSDTDNFTTVISANNTNSISKVEYRNNIFWNNTAGGNTATALLALASSPTIFNSIDEDGFSNIPAPLKNNVSTADPLFVNAGNNDFTLQNISPALDAGLNSAVTSTKDLLNNNRVFNTTVDMGAYEYDVTLSLAGFDTTINFVIYPNPTTAVLNIKSKMVVKNIEVYSILGKKIVTSKSKTIDVSELNVGVYFLKVTTENGSQSTLKFIKE